MVMKISSFQKSSIRVVKSTITRFVSIILISLLGAGVFAGLAAVPSNMKRAGDQYYDEQNVMDVRMLSNYGFSSEDVYAIRGTKGVSGVMASNTIDATGTVGDKDYVFRINGLPKSSDFSDADYINRMKLIEGHWPESDSEAIIIRPSIGLKNIRLSSTVSLNKESNKNFVDFLERTEYTIVGIAKSPYYLSFMQGNTSVGSGMIDYVLYIPQNNFVIDGYTDIYVTITGAKTFNTFEDEYFDSTEATVKRLETLADQRKAYRYNEFQSDLREAKTEYADAQKKINKKLSDAKKSLDNAAAHISASEKKLSTKKSEFSSGETELKAARARLDSGWSEYSNKKAELAKNKAELAEKKAALDNAQTQYDALSQLAALKAARDAAAPDSQEYVRLNAQYQAALQSAGLTEQQAAAKIAAMGTMKSELDKNLAKYNASAVQISQGEKQLVAAKQELENGEKEYSTKSAELERARADLNNAESQLNSGKKSYQSGLIEYNKQKAEANSKLADAKQKIENAEEKLSDMGEPKWYVLDRNMNESFVTYRDDIERMHDLATVFPDIFFLVAALVCLTTMARMVDEDRTLIGTFKALGYSNGKIAGKYLKYAASASLIGSVAGVCIGFWLIPTIIWNAYNIVFALPDMIPAFYWGIAFLSVFSTVFIICISTGIAAKRSLVETPADLMRPKAPKSGKRVFLEYVKPVWSRLSFIQKVTVRNLGLNKKRLIMTLVGILGCTALVVTAFGAKNAVTTLVDKQFGGIFHYTVSIGFSDEKPSSKLISLLSDTAYFEKSTEILQKSAEASLKSNKNDNYNVYVIAPQNAGALTDYVTLIDPDSKKEFNFDEKSVVITKKLAMDLDVGAGDTIMIKYLDESKRHAVTITGITTNYAFNYVYIGKDVYKKAFGELPEFNQFFAITAGGHTNDEIKTYLSSASGIEAISFTDDLMGNIRTSIKSVDKIIWILIIAAGLLAFVVLYNLTNINIGERQRELATLKVLGFYDKETYSYIFRETVILSVIGCLLGLFGGIFLYRAVVATVEADMILLTRDLTWQSYLGAAILTMFFTWIVNQCMKPKIKNIDMLESLKSVE
jgi:putative ABC transport system permease protein